MESSPNQPVFYDPGGRRWKRVRRTWLGLAVMVTTVAGVFVASVLANPWLPKFNLKPAANLPHAVDTQLEPPPLPPRTPSEQKARKAESELRRELAKTRFVPAKRHPQVTSTPPPVAPKAVAPVPAKIPYAKPLSIAFYINGDDSSYYSLKRNLAQLDWVVPEWVFLKQSQDASSPITVDFGDRPALDLMRRARPQMPIVPLVQNFANNAWDSKALVQAVGDEGARQRLVTALLSMVDANKFGGVCLDFEEVPSTSQADLLHFVEELHAAFQARGFTVAQAVPFDDAEWDYHAYGAATDYLLLMGYDEHWMTGEAGPVAGEDWYERALAKRMAELDPAHTIVCIGGYGYDWTKGTREAKEVTFQEAVLSARDSEARVHFDSTTRNPYFQYEEDDGSFHTVWFLDAATAYNETRLAINDYHPAGFALWRLGSEDPSIWSIFGNANLNAPANATGKITYPYDVDFEGTGEVLQVTSAPQDGARSLRMDQAGLISGEDFTAVPSSYVIQRTGNHPGKIALTFDDGPDPAWTPRILDILKQEHVPATFFVIGQNGQANPQLVRRIYDEGHDIGNHTYTHPNLGEMPGRITDLELNATQRLIESLTGHSTRLFRPPYFGDAEPQTPDEVEPIVRAQALGYIAIGLKLDPDDWKLRNDDGTPRTAADIVNKSVARAMDTNPDTRGEVLLLHDGGGNRAMTVEALPEIIRQLRARGFEFTTISDLAGMPRDQAMPPVPADQSLFARADQLTFYSLSVAGRLLHWTFVIGIILGLARMVLIGGLAFAQWVRARRREHEHFGEGYEPPVSIIVPAYNEERVITRTIDSLLASTYPRFEIIVVDDGSPDRTSEVVREKYETEPRVRLFTKSNAGKAEALNYGLRRAAGEIIVALDADTLFAPESIAALAHRFVNPQIAAVAGNAKVGNRINIITRWQALEYITSQNLDRRAFVSLNCITVVPGAVGAYRRELLEKVGGFASDTLAEDQDLTIKLRRLGFKIGYEEAAVAWTEAPDTLRALSRQRYRWAYGTLQCMWKHRDALFRPRYGALGFVAMPNVWIFQVLFPLISPVMDLLLVWSFASAALARWEHGAEYTITNLNQVVFYYALFLAVDWLAAAFAFVMERRERWRLLWWLLLQRFCYRQVMYYVMVKSVASAARGALVGWNKLERKATAQAGP